MQQDAPRNQPTRRGFLAGGVAALPVLLAVAPFGLIFGTLAAEAGFDLLQVMAFTSMVVAGASQLAALQVLSDGAPALIAVLTGAVVNLRMAMYSASIAVHWQGLGMIWRIPAAFFLHDQAFALSVARYRTRPDESVGDKAGFFFGVGVVTVTVWIMATWVGAEIGARIPESWGLGFAVPVCFIAVVAPMIRGTANVVAALTAGTLAVLLAGLPGGMSLLIASAGGIAAGMAAGRRVARRLAAEGAR